MMRAGLCLLVGVAVLSSVACASLPATQPDPCAHDREAMLALDEDAFDQDIGGGWRALAAMPGCEPAAADLIAAYRQLHPQAAGIVAWHEGQLRASAGQTTQAIPLLEAARKPVEQDLAGWNHYVDATVAFLRRDRAALQAARERLQAVPWTAAEGMADPVDGVIEVTLGNGQTMRMRWPPNIDVVDGFLACFDRPYDEAYGADCRPPLPSAD